MFHVPAVVLGSDLRHTLKVRLPLHKFYGRSIVHGIARQLGYRHYRDSACLVFDDLEPLPTARSLLHEHLQHSLLFENWIHEVAHWHTWTLRGPSRGHFSISLAIQGDVGLTSIFQVKTVRIQARVTLAVTGLSVWPSILVAKVICRSDRSVFRR